MTGWRCAVFGGEIKQELVNLRILLIMQLNVKLRSQSRPSLPTKAGKVTVQGSNANVSHTINEDERTLFTEHINTVRRALIQSGMGH